MRLRRHGGTKQRLLAAKRVAATGDLHDVNGYKTLVSEGKTVKI